MAIHLADRFTCGLLLRSPLPAVAMSLFTSVSSVAEGWFVSNGAGKEALAAVTLAFPLLGVLGAAGSMRGAGGCAHVGRLQGEGRRREPGRPFPSASTRPWPWHPACPGRPARPRAPHGTLRRLGRQLAQSVLYGPISLLSLPCFMLLFYFQPFFACAERPQFGLAVTVGAGLANIALEALLVAGLGWGLAGAHGRGRQQSPGRTRPLGLLCARTPGTARPGAPPAVRSSPRFLGGDCANGCSKFLINIAYPLLTCLYHWHLMHLAGEDEAPAGLAEQVRGRSEALASPRETNHFPARCGDCRFSFPPSTRLRSLPSAPTVLPASRSTHTTATRGKEKVRRNVAPLTRAPSSTPILTRCQGLRSSLPQALAWGATPARCPSRKPTPAGRTDGEGRTARQ